MTFAIQRVVFKEIMMLKTLKLTVLAALLAAPLIALADDCPERDRAMDSGGEICICVFCYPV